MEKITHARSANRIPIFRPKICAHPRNKNSITDKDNSIIFRQPIRLNYSCLPNFTKGFLSNPRHPLRDMFQTRNQRVLNHKNKGMNETQRVKKPATIVHWEEGEVIYTWMANLLRYHCRDPGDCKRT